MTPEQLKDATLLYSLIDEAESLNLVVNNLFQVANNLYQANLRDGNSMQFHAFGQGRTPGTALEAAMSDARPLALKAIKNIKTINPDDFFS